MRKKWAESQTFTPPSRLRWLALASGLSALAACFASRVLLERPDLPARLAVALAPIPFFVFFLAAFVRLARGVDELEPAAPGSKPSRSPAPRSSCSS
jgi:hypothetical protein